jgi:hypothetical protein
MVLNEDDSMKHHMEHVQDELKKAEHNAHELEMMIGDTNESWEDA